MSIFGGEDGSFFFFYIQITRSGSLAPGLKEKADKNAGIFPKTREEQASLLDFIKSLSSSCAKTGSEGVSRRRFSFFNCLCSGNTGQVAGPAKKIRKSFSNIGLRAPSDLLGVGSDAAIRHLHCANVEGLAPNVDHDEMQGLWIIVHKDDAGILGHVGQRLSCRGLGIKLMGTGGFQQLYVTLGTIPRQIHPMGPMAAKREK